MASMTEYFTTHGPVRGECGHRHQSIETAVACVERDRRGCARQGGYSDRVVTDQALRWVPVPTVDDADEQ